MSRPAIPWHTPRDGRRVEDGSRGSCCVAVVALTAAACQGEWRRLRTRRRSAPSHVALLHTGKVLLVAGSGNNQGDFNAGTFTTSLWDPTTETFQSVATPWDAFCAGHAFLPDGRLLVAGGNTAYPGPATNNANAGSHEGLRVRPGHEQVRRRSRTWRSPAGTRPSSSSAAATCSPSAASTRPGCARTPARSSTARPTGRRRRPRRSQLSFMPMYPALHLLKDGRLFYSGANVFGPGPALPGIWNFTTNAWTAGPRPHRPGPPRPGR